MTTRYVEALRSLLGPTVAALPPGVDVAIKRFFGGAAAYAEGRICITLTPVGLAMKLPADGRARLTAEGATPLRYFPGAPTKTQYVIAPEDLPGNAERLRFWVRQSIDHVLTLPAPDRKRRHKPKS